jgi:glutaryl-CoA dehydrogenase
MSSPETNNTGRSSNNSSILNLHSNLPSDTLSLLRSIEDWGRQELEPYIAEHWDKATFPPHLLNSFRQHLPHLLGYNLPRQYGGAGMDRLRTSQVSMTLAKIDASFTTTLLVQYGLCAESILLCGTAEQRTRLLPAVARLDQMGCFCLTEPQSGSDASSLETIAVRLPGRGGYVVSGSKRWIGNAIDADIFVVWARNMSLPGTPVMGFILERKDQSGRNTNNNNVGAIQTSKIEGKVSMRILQNANVEFKDAYCPDHNVMGDYGKSHHGGIFLVELRFCSVR